MGVTDYLAGDQTGRVVIQPQGIGGGRADKAEVGPAPTGYAVGLREGNLLLWPGAVLSRRYILSCVEHGCFDGGRARIGQPLIDKPLAYQRTGAGDQRRRPRGSTGIDIIGVGFVHPGEDTRVGIM